MKASKNLGNTLFFIRQVYRINPRGIWIKLSFVILSIMTPFIPMLFFRWILNALQEKQKWTDILFYTCMFAFISFLHGIIKDGAARFDDRQSTQSSRLLKKDLSKQIIQLPYSEAEDPKIRDFIQMVQESVDLSSLFDVIFSLVTQIITLFGLMAVVLTLQPLLLLLIAVVLLLRVFVNSQGRKIWDRFRDPINQTMRKGNYLIYTMQAIEYGKEIRINALQDCFERKLNDCVIEYATEMKEYNQHLQRWNALAEFAVFLQEVAVYILLSVQVFFGGMPIGDFSLYRTGISSFSEGLSAIVDSISELLRMGQFLEQYRQLMERFQKSNAAKSAIKNTNEDLMMKTVEIRFEHVSFHYPNSENLVLNDINFTLKTGESISIVGLNGAGKTTLVKLLCRFYEPISGKIMLNGMDIQKIPMEEYRKQFGVVFQDFRLFAFSVLENIALTPPYNEDQVWHALEKCSLLTKVEALERGIHTPMSKELDEQGVEFSGGETQRAGLARILYKNPPIIILDEPTAALDPMTEYELYQNMYNLTKDKCSIFISHRLPSTRFTDFILVFQEGKILEYGTFKDLMMKEQGMFRTMYDAQSIYYRNTEGDY